MRKMAILIVAVLSVISAQIARVTADDSPIVREVWQELVEKRRLAAPDIASVLTYWGGNGTIETRVVRWRDGPRRLVVVAVGDAKDEAGSLVGIMTDALSAIGRSGEFCTQTVTVSGDGVYSPSLGKFECLKDPSDVIVVVDSASGVSTKLLQDLHDRTAAAGEESAWGGPAKMDSDYFTQTSCGALVTVDRDSDRIRAGSAYLHAVAQGVRILRPWINAFMPCRFLSSAYYRRFLQTSLSARSI